MSTEFGKSVAAVSVVTQGEEMQYQDEIAQLAVRSRIEGGIVVIDVSGNVIAPAMYAAKRSIIEWLRTIGPVAGYLIDYRAADVRCALDEMNRLLSEADADMDTAPAALVVRQDDVPLFQQHVWALAWRGVVRAAFIDRARAAEWIRERAAVAAQVRSWQPDQSQPVPPRRRVDASARR